MAKLMLIGETAHVELTSDPEDGGIIATCTGHLQIIAGSGDVLTAGCQWSERYYSMGDATEYAADHADTGRMDS